MKDYHNEMGLCTLFREACQRIESEEGEASVLQLLNETYQKFVKEGEAADYELPESDGEAFRHAAGCLENTFLSEKSVSALRSGLEAAREKRQQLLSHTDPGNPFPSMEDIDEYLTAYYKLLVSVFSHIKEIQESGLLKQSFLQYVLNVDICFSEDGSFSYLYAPAALDGLKHIYDGLKNYRRLAGSIRSGELKRSYREIFISKVLRLFRWKIANGRELLQAAIPAYIPDTEKERGSRRWTLNIPVRNIEDFSSFEGIGELRLLDKVIYELEKRTAGQGEEKRSFIVTLLGDINEEPMKLLCRMLAYLIKKDKRFIEARDISVCFEIYTCNDERIERKKYEFLIGEEGDNSVSCHFNPYQKELLNKKDLGGILADSDIVFLLDMCHLYNDPQVDELADKNLFWQRVASDTYLKNYDRSHGGENMVRRGCFKALVQILYGASYSGRIGRIEKEINTTLLKYLSALGDRETKKSIYVYVSDVEALGEFYRDDKHFIRVERYNEKEIAILRMSGYKDEGLPLKHTEERIIVFTLWQLTKHVAIRDYRGMLEFLGLDAQQPEQLCMLKDILVGVDYAAWPERLNLYYQLPKTEETPEGLEEKVKEYLEEVVLPFFQVHENDMYYEYFLKSIGAFLYSDAKDVNDMLFLHLFMNQHGLLKKAVIASRREDLEDYRPDKCKYSQKKFYEDMMRDYDTSSANFGFKYSRLSKMERDGRLLRGDMFENIKKACEWNHYENSYLYENCDAML